MPRGEEKLGKSTLRWDVTKDGGFVGVVNADGKRVFGPIEDADEARLIARLRNEAGRLHHDYVGFDGAIRRFAHFMPNGFASAINERAYKERAGAKLASAVPLDLAAQADDAAAKAIASGGVLTNMLSPFEAARLRDTLVGPNGARFVCGAAHFTAGQHAMGIEAMTTAVHPHGRISWPIITYLPFLWAPADHMFLKPTVTCDFSARVGLRFHHAYDPEPNAATYDALLDLVAETRTTIAALEPRDNIDVQIFIWVVGEYSDDDGQE
jgi:hypothetical protein